MRRTNAWMALLVVGLLVVTAAACGDDNNRSSDATGTTDGATTTVALTGPAIKMMVMFEGSGAVATPEVQEGAKAAVQAINASGGVDGSPIELVECDLANDPNAARACGQQAVDKGVIAVVGPVSANAGEYIPLLEAAHIPLIGNVPAAPADFASPVAFPLYGGLVTASAGLADVLASVAGAKNISVARIDFAAAAAIGVFGNQALARSGLAVLNDVSIPTGAPDMATYVASVLQGGTDGVLVVLSGQDATNFLIQLHQTNPKVPVSFTTTDFKSVLKALGDAADGIYLTGSFEDATTAPDAYQQFVGDIKAAGFAEPGYGYDYGINAYSAVHLAAKVAAGLSAKTSAALLAALPTAGPIDLPLLPPINFATGGVGGLPRVFNPCGVYRQIEGGKIKTLSHGFINLLTGAAC